MDLRRLRAGEWIIAISGIVLLVSLFLPWSEIEDGSVTTFTGWEVLSVADVLLALLGVGAVAVLLITARAPSTAPGVAGDALLTPFALAMTIVCLLQIGDYDQPGAAIALAATIGVLVGALVAMRDERLSKPGRLTDQTGVPVERALEIEKLPAPPSA
jgi:hypothetical protein